MSTPHLPHLLLFRCTMPGRRALPAALFLLTLLAALPVACAAQQAASTPPHKPVPRARSRHAAKPAAQPAQAVLAPAPPPAPPMPDWPVNDKPSPAAITWNASGLRIEASNSSLQQILKEVSTLTGATVEGLGSDERVFGNFGPAPTRDVLASLLDGSHYNMLLIGDQGQGTPRRIVLTLRGGKSALPAATSANSSDDTDEDAEQDDQAQDQNQNQDQPQPPFQQPRPPLVRNNFGQVPPRQPQQNNPQ